VDFQDILYEKQDGVATVTLNRPEAGNRVTTHTMGEVAEAFLDAEGDDSIGVAVLTGKGREAFHSGGEWGVHRERTQTNFRQHIAKALHAYTIIRNLGKPVICAVNGRAEAGGNQIAATCDFTIAADHAVFCQHGMKHGSAPFLWGIQILPLIIGEKRAREMLIMCREYTAQEAYEIGLVNKVVPYEELYAETDRWCQHILNLSPQSVRLCKTSMNFRSDLHYPAIYHGREFMGLMAGSDELVEGATSAVEGREPDFRQFRRPR
jgi:dihydroxynaphthoic acid synthetase